MNAKKTTNKPKTRKKPTILEFDKGTRTRCHDLAEKGLTDSEIANALGISYSYLKQTKQKDEKVREAIEIGKSKAIDTIENKLYRAAYAGNVTAMIFFLKNKRRDEWSENVHNKVSGDITVNFTGEEKMKD